jgi:hypothetical protein
MSSLSDLAPLPEKKAYTNKKALDTSVDDFDALLDDMLDSPKVKRPVKSNSQKSKSSKQGTSKKDDFPIADSTDDGEKGEISSQKTGSKTAGKDVSKDYMYDSDELSVDNGLLASYTANDDLEDSILGGLLKGNNKGGAKKVSAFGNKVPATTNMKTSAVSSSSVATAKKIEAIQSPVENDFDGGYDFSDAESSEDDKKPTSGLAAKFVPSSSSSGVGAAVVPSKQVMYGEHEEESAIFIPDSDLIFDLSDNARCGFHVILLYRYRNLRVVTSLRTKKNHSTSAMTRTRVHIRLQ